MKTFTYSVLFTLLACFFCFFALGRLSFSLDEVSTLSISLSWQSMWHILWTQEGNMWLYSFLIYFWLFLGKTEWILRSLSALFAVCTVPFFYLLAKDLVGKNIAKLATLLLVTNLTFIYFAQTARGYSLALFLVTLSSYFFVKIAQGKSSKILWTMYVVVHICAIYTYLFAGLILVTQYLAYFFLPKNTSWKKMIFAAAAIGICLLPLVLSPAFQGGHQLDWLAKPSLIQLPFSIVALAGDSLIVGLLSCASILFFLWVRKSEIFKKSFSRFAYLWLILWVGFPILSTSLISLFIKPIYQPQYFNTSLPAFVLLVSLGIYELRKKKWVFIGMYTAIVLFSLFRLFLWYSGSMQKEIIFSNTNPWDWKKVASYITVQGQKTDGIIFYAYYIRNPFDYYFSQIKVSNKPTAIEIATSRYPIGGGTALPEENTHLLESLSKKYPRLWLVLAYNNTSIQHRSSEWQEIENELQPYYKISQDISFNQIEVELLDKK